MTETVIVSLIAFCGTCVGSLGGIIAANRLTNYRVEQLEKKVSLHNRVMERTYILEEKMKVANHRLDDLEREDHERRI